MKSDVSETELYCTGQQNPNIETEFLPAGPSIRIIIIIIGEC